MTAPTQQQTACDPINSTVGHSPFARPGSRAGASTVPTTPTGMPSASTSPFAQPGSHTGSARSEVDFPRAAPQAAGPSNCDSPISSLSDTVFPRDMNTSTSKFHVIRFGSSIITQILCNLHHFFAFFEL